MIDDEAMRARDAQRCTCGHKRVSHGSFNAAGEPVGIGHGPCGIDRDARNALTGWLGDRRPCEAFTPVAPRVPGQLWERVHVSTPHSDLRPVKQGKYLIDCRPAIRTRATSGIIRAGVRVK